MFLDKVKLKYKLLFNVVLMAILGLQIVLIGKSGLYIINSEVDAIYNRGLVPIKEIMQLKIDLLTQQGDLLAFINTFDETSQKKIELDILDLEKKIDLSLSHLINISDQSEKKALNEIMEIYSEYKKTNKTKLIPYVYDMETDGALELVNGIQHKRFNKIDEISKLIQQKAIENAQISKNLADEIYSNQISLLWLIAIGGILVLGIITLIISRNIVNSIGNIIDRIRMLIEDVNCGVLNSRIDHDDVSIDFIEISNSANGIIEAFIKPLNVTEKYIDKISKGEVPPKITDEYMGDFNLIKNNLNSLIDVMCNLILETSGLIDETKIGNLDKRADEFKFSGEWKKLVSGINSVVDSMAEPFEIAINFLDDVSHGRKLVNISENYQGKYGMMINNINDLGSILNVILSELASLAKEVNVNGLISKRIDLEFVAGKGSWKTILKGINKIVDSIAEPLNIVSERIIELGEGKIPAKIDQEYKGDILTITDAVNKAIESVAAIDDAARILNKLSVYDITEEFKGNYSGLFASLKDSINLLRERFANIQNITGNIAEGDLSDLVELKKIGRLSKEDRVSSSFIDMMESIDGLVADSKILAQAAAEGNLSLRIAKGKHRGRYEDIIQGSNQTLDNMLKPFNIAMKFIEDTANGILSDKITEKASGDYKKLYSNMNLLTEEFTNIIGQILDIVRAATNGELEKRIDITMVKGKWQEILNGVNNIMEELLSPVNEAVGVISKMASGDLSVNMIGNYKGDHAILKNALNDTLGHLNDLLIQVNNTVELVDNGAAQVSDASQSLSQGATEQAASLEEILASMQEVGSQSKHNAKNAAIASNLSLETHKNADEGNLQMKELEVAMKNIDDSSNQIVKVIKAINDIAFQTNLLAINAAVEAARAGVHGKGFAVVASEVRSLAQKSAKAADETTELIEGTIKQIERGNELSNRTAEFLTTIVDGISKVTNIVEEISTASEEQDQGITQSIDAIEQVSNVTQKNAANSEETASASVELTSQADKLKSMIAKFKLNHSKSDIYHDSNIIEHRENFEIRKEEVPALEFTEVGDGFGEF